MPMQRRLMLARPPGGIVYKTITTQGYVSTSTGTTTASTLSLAFSSLSPTAGCFAVVVGAWLLGSSTLTMNRAGWSATGAINISTTLSSRLWYKVIDATDLSNDTFTITSGGGAGCAALGLHIFQNVDTANPTNGFTSATNSVNGTAQPLAVHTPTAYPSFIASFAAMSQANGGIATTWPAGWTECIDRITSRASGRQASVTTATLNASPLTSGSTPAGDLVPSTSTHNADWTMALQPAVGP